MSRRQLDPARRRPAPRGQGLGPESSKPWQRGRHEPEDRHQELRRGRQPQAVGLPAARRLRRRSARRSTMAPAAHRRRGQEVEPARPRRRRLPDRHEVALRPQGGQDGLPGRQRRRVRARHLQGPRADGLRPAPADRGDGHRGVRARLQARLHLHPRRDDARGADRRRRPSTRPTRPATSARTTCGRAARSSWTSRCTAAPARTSAARRPALLNSLEGKRGWPRLKPPFPAVQGPVPGSRRSSTTSRR